MTTAEMQMVREMFAVLRKHGIIARMAHECCSTCAWASLESDTLVPTPAVFFHKQDDAHARSSADASLAIAYGYTHTDLMSNEQSDRLQRELGRIVAEAAVGCGLYYEWNSDPSQRVILQHKELT